ncbi:cytochrome CYP82D47 [Capsicum galapagoense]
MDCPFSSYFHLLLFVLFTVSSILWKSRKTLTSTKILAPQVPGAWPIIGHLHYLSVNKNVPFARTLGKLTDKYGPAFTIRIGISPYLIVSNWEVAKNCFTTNDKELSGRPATLASELIGYNYARFSYSNYGPYYRHVRKLVLQLVLSSSKLEKLKHVRISEIETSIKELYSWTNVKSTINISEWFEQLTLNIIVRMVRGKRYNRVEEDEEAQRMRKIFRDTMFVSGQVVLYDAIPFKLFKYVDFQGHIKSMKKIFKDFDGILQGWLDDHVRKENIIDDENQDFIDAMLMVTDRDDFKAHGYSQSTVIKSTVLSMIEDGSDTMAVHLTWIMSLLLNNPHVMKKAQEEIDTKIGKERWIEDSDVQDLVYLQAIVKETLRLYPPVPLLVPHEAVEDCKVAGYHVSKGTRLYVNVWQIHRDPNIYSDPESFMPERFLTKEIRIEGRGQHFEFIPFGSGRRSCPGMTFASLVTHVILGRLLQGFDISTPSNMPIDMTEGLGITMPKANPVEVVITPRLSSKFYEF